MILNLIIITNCMFHKACWKIQLSGKAATWEQGLSEGQFLPCLFLPLSSPFLRAFQAPPARIWTALIENVVAVWAPSSHICICSPYGEFKTINRWEDCSCHASIALDDGMPRSLFPCPKMWHLEKWARYIRLSEPFYQPLWSLRIFISPASGCVWAITEEKDTSSGS